METLDVITNRLNEFFRIADSAKDPAFSRFLPTAYEGANHDWRSWAEPDFADRFNGLMLRGSDTVNNVFLASFPSDVVLRDFVDKSPNGGLLFTHHPIDLESGDPRGNWGNFFRPIPHSLIREMQRKHLSIYSCHAPLDYNTTISTSRSIASALGGVISSEFFPYGSGFAGVIANMKAAKVTDVEATLQRIFGVAYLDVAGARPESIRTIAIVAGAGDRVEQMEVAEAMGAHAYITGEIHARIDSDYGREKFAAVEGFAAKTSMALLGVSHAASEFLVMKNEMREWFRNQFHLETALLPEPHWWR